MRSAKTPFPNKAASTDSGVGLRLYLIGGRIQPRTLPDRVERERQAKINPRYSADCKSAILRCIATFKGFKVKEAQALGR